MQSFCLIASVLQMLRQLIHHLFGVAEYDGTLQIIGINQSADGFFLVNIFHYIIILLYQRNCQLLLGNPHDHRILLVFVGNV